MAKREGGSGKHAGGGKRAAGRGQRRADRGPHAGKTGKCASCGGTDFEDGTIALYNSISYLVFSSEKRPFVTLGNSLRARVCLGCGRVELFAPLIAFTKKAPKA